VKPGFFVFCNLFIFGTATPALPATENLWFVFLLKSTVTPNQRNDPVS
jgi:hypothetical protein